MKSYSFIILSLLLINAAVAQTKIVAITQPNVNLKIDTVQTACGECQFGLKGKSCDLAVRIKNKSYFVDGTNINDHGDAHADNGFCNAVTKAVVQGKLVNNRYKVTYFKLL